MGKAEIAMVSWGREGAGGEAAAESVFSQAARRRLARGWPVCAFKRGVEERAAFLTLCTRDGAC